MKCLAPFESCDCKDCKEFEKKYRQWEKSEGYDPDFESDLIADHFKKQGEKNV